MKHCYRLNYFIVFLLFCLITIGCPDNHSSDSFVKVEAERTKLINGIESYISIDDFKGFLNRHSLHWEASGDDQPSPKSRPPFNIYKITIKNYSHLSFLGYLEIVFFNNRLKSSTFYPSDFTEYINSLEKAAKIKFDNNQQAQLKPYTRIRLGINYKGRKFVTWSDIRLDKEVEIWIKNYT